MSGPDLRVDAVQLREVSARVTGAVTSVRFEGSMRSVSEHEIGSGEVANALRDCSAQEHRRAELVAAALQAVGNSPAAAVAAFLQADQALAKVF